MPANATSAQLLASSYSPAALLGRSLGRSARLATEWVSAVTGSAESAIVRTLKLRPSGPPAVPALLLEELAALLRGQPEGQLAALAKNAKFWSLVEQLHAVRHRGAADDTSAPIPITSEPVQVVEADANVVDAAVLPAAVPAVDAAVLPAAVPAVEQDKPKTAAASKTGARPAAAQTAAVAAEDGSDTSADPKPKPEAS
jgi:hypothetical protein